MKVILKIFLNACGDLVIIYFLTDTWSPATSRGSVGFRFTLPVLVVFVDFIHNPFQNFYELLLGVNGVTMLQGNRHL